MNKIKLIVFLLLLLNFSLSSQNWLPLEVGNKWQFLKANSTGTQIPNLTTTFELFEKIIDQDTVINDQKFYKCGADYYRYSENDQKIFFWWNNEERVYMDFNKAIGDTFHNGTSVYTVTGGTKILFADTLEFKGFRRTYISQPNNTSITIETRFLQNIGWYSSLRGSVSFYNTSWRTEELLMGIVYDSLGTEIFITGNYKPLINFVPKLTTNTRLFNLGFSVDHLFNRYPSTNSSGFSFIGSVIMESYYSNNDSIYTLPDKITFGNPGGNYSFVTLLDTNYMKNGYTFNYRFIVKDKGIIPEVSYSPDSGYYQCVWDFSTNVEPDAYLLNSFALHQNYPNPFNPSTKISWQSPVGSHQTLKVFDVLGREVATLVDEYKDAGYHEVEFQSAVGNKQLASGIYYYQLRSGSFIETKKMMVIK